MPRIEDRMGISYRQLDSWCREGYLRPVRSPGSQRTWPELELRIGRMMSRLVGLGITPYYAAYYARAAVEHKIPMLLEFRNGKLSVKGPFASTLKQALKRQQEVRDAREYPELDRQERAC